VYRRSQVRGQDSPPCRREDFRIVAFALFGRAWGGEEEGGEVVVGAGVIFGICGTCREDGGTHRLPILRFCLGPPYQH